MAQDPSTSPSPSSKLLGIIDPDESVPAALSIDSDPRLLRCRRSRNPVGSSIAAWNRVLCESSLFFKGMVMGSRKKDEIVVEDVEDLGAFRETMEMMYEKDLMRWLVKAGVSKSIDVLEVSSKILFDRGVESCLNYIEAVPWSESEEEKLKSLFARCTFDEVTTQDILSRLQLEGTRSSDDLAVHLIQSIAEGTNVNARKELQSLVNGLLSKSSVYQKDPAGLNKESLYRICHSCLNSLVELFNESSDPTHADKKAKPLVERVIKQVDNLNWLLEILIDKQMAEDFVYLWANQKELIRMHPRASPMVRYELSRISAHIFIALGRGKLRCPGNVRFSVLDSWFGPMLLDFGWLQRCSKGLDIGMLEEGLGQALLTLPLNQQQSLFVEWFRVFGGKGMECPNLSKAFQIWWRRSFVRTAEGRS
ncbi:uncharacterized protein A4U43_C02F6280 [Asparagus officinalis]|uniref:At3g05675-like ankyrin-like domain-containing protein n=1 Tax=Asparagus officinalis TaxID=4686 RepID=A0A5P1FH63_ASPOF|nr:uncharacterized protein A4U43_C02F6280 [Asparagus officinalis]